MVSNQQIKRRLELRKKGLKPENENLNSCHQCGTENESRAIFCMECGKKNW